ncbi:hypothetical protein A8709_20215 [Paenibacillus pectinilyticus]|uniref:DUF1648 domain-containing protein n=1 Tax=Paenibacillus pectinilyticus TaxID=512399 RepID=A0A1C0ZY79_9BACL|nr:hypothetical protein A8709_20215 [Paenibacillus pectinilyticus]
MIQLPRTKTETALDAICLLVIISMIAYAAYEWQGLPERIPMHFDAKGNIDGWGNKWSLIPIPVIGIIIYVGLSLLGKVPHVFNYPSQITEANAPGQYQNARLFINCLKTVIVVLFGFIEWSILHSAKEGTLDLNLWVLGLLVVVMLGTIVFFIVRSFKLR